MKTSLALAVILAGALAASCIRKQSHAARPSGPSTLTPDAEFRSRPPALGPEPLAFVPKIERSTLSNGMAVWVVERPDLPFAALFYANRGAHDDGSRGAHGLAALTLETILSATLDEAGRVVRDPQVDGELPERSVAHVGSLVRVRATAPRVPEATRLLASWLRRPAFDADSLAEAKRFVAGTAAHLAIRGMYEATLLAALYGSEQVLSLPITGLPQTTGRLSERDVKAFHSKHYGPKNSALIAVGAVGGAEMLALARQSFEDWSAPAEIAEPPPFPEATLSPNAKRKVTGSLGSRATVLVTIALPCLGTSSPDELVFDLISTILAKGTGSRSFVALRHSSGSTYGVSADCYARVNSGEFYFTFDVAPPRFGESTERALGELNSLATVLVSEPELTAAKRSFLSEHVARIGTNAGLAESLAVSYLARRPADYHETLEARVSAVTAQDVRRVAASHFQRDRMRVVVRGDPNELGQQSTSLGPIQWQ